MMLEQLKSRVLEVAHRKSDWQELEADLKQEIGRSGCSPARETQLRVLLGELYWWLGRLGESRAQYRMALSLDPSCVEAMLGIGLTFSAVARWASADKWFGAAYAEACEHGDYARQMKALEYRAYDASRRGDAQALSDMLHRMCDTLATAPRIEDWSVTIAESFVVEGRGAEVLPFMRCLIHHMLRCGYPWSFQYLVLRPFVEFWRRQGEPDQAIRSMLADMRSLACDEDAAGSFDKAVDWAFEKGRLYYEHVYGDRDPTTGQA